MIERPILMSAMMVRARLAGRKTQTRRIVKLDAQSVLGTKRIAEGWEWSYDDAVVGDLSYLAAMAGNLDGIKNARKYQQLNVPVRHPDDRRIPFSEGFKERFYCPYGAPGDRLWVKETFARVHPGMLYSLDPDPGSLEWKTIHRADGSLGDYEGRTPWRPSIFMSRQFSRITMPLAAVRVERLRDITVKDMIAEGAFVDTGDGLADAEIELLARDAWVALWNSIHLKPKPVYGRDREIVSYISYPWSLKCFQDEAPNVFRERMYRSKPIAIIENPWVWVLEMPLA